MSAIESKEMKEMKYKMCVADAYAWTDPCRRHPEGTRSTAKCWLRDTELDKQTVSVGTSGERGPMMNRKFCGYYFTELKFIEGDQEVFENFRAQLRERYQKDVEFYIQQVANPENPEDPEYYQGLITFMQNVINSI